MENTLPKIKNKKKIDTNKFVKKARELKKLFEEEVEYLRKKARDNENLSSGKSL